MSKKVQVLAFVLIGFLCVALGSQVMHWRLQAVALDEEVGHLIIVGLNDTDFDEVKDAAHDGLIGSVVIYGSAFHALDDLRQKIQSLQATSRFPLLITLDAEGGAISRIGPAHGGEEIPSAQEMGEKGDAFTSASSRRLAKTLAQIGVSLNLAPVVDLNLNPNNPIIGGLNRSFSDQPAVVVARARAFIAAHLENGVQTTLKHFPGHGSSASDSHLGFTDVSQSWQAQEIEPYRQIVSEGFSGAIMVGHLFNAQFDPNYPASLSHATIDGLLRHDLGFRGAVITDDLQMGAITAKYDTLQTIKLALGAGNDLLMFAQQFRHDDIRWIHQQIVNLVKSGEISRERLQTSVARMQKLMPPARRLF